MVIPAASLLILPLLLTSSKVNGRHSNCDTVVVNDPSFLFGQDEEQSTPIGEYLTEDVTECMDVCCNEQKGCNVGLLLEHAHKHDKNCLLYSCHPIDSCSLEINKYTVVFIDQTSVENEIQYYLQTTTPRNDYAYNDYYNVHDEDYKNNTNFTVVTNDTINKNIDEGLSNGHSSSLTENEVEILEVASSGELATKLSSIEVTSSQPKLEMTTTNMISENEELISNLDYIVNTSEKFMYSHSSLISSSSQVTTLQVIATEISDHFDFNLASVSEYQESNDTVLANTNNVYSSTTFSDNKFWKVSQTLPGNTSHEVIEVSFSEMPSSTTMYSYSPVVMKTDNAPTLLESSDGYTIEEDEDNTILSTEVMQPTWTLVTTATAKPEVYTSSVIGMQLSTQNATDFRDVNGDQKRIEPVTVILICILTVGCVFALAVAGVLSARIYEGYQKRHYTRLDYLMNGMYN